MYVAVALIVLLLIAPYYCVLAGVLLVFGVEFIPILRDHGPSIGIGYFVIGGVWGISKHAVRISDRIQERREAKLFDQSFYAESDDSDRRSDNPAGTDNTAPPTLHHKAKAYQVLGLPGPTHPDDVRRAYRALVKQWHPDRLDGLDGLAPELKQLATTRLAAINAAYQIILEEDAR